MTYKKRTLVITLICVIIFVCGSFLTLDLYRFYISGTGIKSIDSTPIKKLIPLLCALIVLIIGKDGINKNDTKKLMLIYALICFADTALIFDMIIPGIGLFAVCQVLLIWRNGAGISKLLSGGELGKDRNALIICAAVILAVIVLIMSFIFYPILHGSPLFFAMLGYVVLLGASLWTSFANYKLKLFPRRNSILVLTGMILFFLGDFLVGLDLALKEGFYWLVVSSMVWIIYTPSITLIALSGYRYEP